jgi:ribonuclease P protein component
MDYPAGKTLRVTRRADIDRLFDTGGRASNSVVMICAHPNGLSCTRGGVAVGVRHGNAVKRNRIKRICREAIRLTRPELPAGWDFMLVPRAGRAMTLAAVRDALTSLAAKAVQNYPRAGKPPAAKEG